MAAVSSRFSSPFSRRQRPIISSPLCPILPLKVIGDKGQPYKTACRQKGQRTSPHKAQSILMTTVTKKAEDLVLSKSSPRLSNTQSPLFLMMKRGSHCNKLSNRGWGWLGIFFFNFWYWSVTDHQRVTVSGEEWRDLTVHIHVSISPKLPSRQAAA